MKNSKILMKEKEEKEITKEAAVVQMIIKAKYPNTCMASLTRTYSNKTICLKEEICLITTIETSETTEEEEVLAEEASKITDKNGQENSDNKCSNEVVGRSETLKGQDKIKTGNKVEIK